MWYKALLGVGAILAVLMLRTKRTMFKPKNQLLTTLRPLWKSKNYSGMGRLVKESIPEYAGYSDDELGRYYAFEYFDDRKARKSL